jgi:hypothetical protein
MVLWKGRSTAVQLVSENESRWIGRGQSNQGFLKFLNVVIVPKYHNGQLSIEEFHVPIGGSLNPENLLLLFSSLMPREELEDHMPLNTAPRLALLQSL